ncbi:uncharacterized protein LOC128315890 [Acinonyx jubatus]|uniref:Uncharacterized protein LOC128315890 n=1 Tax=Acinonyx jubatus TaxID=32536 RepID=A0ABM3Q6W5_ACIJB|nr:uncharacterized protein LOC128315890 [Acinonyx jubatus]
MGAGRSRPRPHRREPPPHRTTPGVPRLTLAAHAAALSPAPGFTQGNVFDISLQNSVGPARSHLFLTPAKFPPDAPTRGGHRPSWSLGARSGNRDQGPRADGSIEDPELPASGGVTYTPPYPAFPCYAPASSPWATRVRAGVVAFPGFQCPRAKPLSRRAASRKAKLVAPKGERRVPLLEVANSLESISEASSGFCLPNQRATHCAPGSALPREVLCRRPRLATGHSHNGSGDKDGNGGEVRGQRSLAEVRRASGQVQMELDPLKVTTRRGHLQCERATLDWGILILKGHKLK